MRRNNLLKAVRSGQPAIGPQLWSGSPEIVEIMGQFPFHFINLEMEHSSYASFESVTHLCRAADSVGITPIASLGANDPLLITKVLEAGAMGVVVPHITSKEAAMKAVNAAKYPPAGHRGAAPIVRQSSYGMDASSWPIYADEINQQVAVIGKVEDAEALEHLDDILSTPIDGLMVGAFDLSHSLGIAEARGKVFHPKVVEARNLILDKCRQYSKFATVVLGQVAEQGEAPADTIAKWSAKGVLAYMLDTDLGWIREACHNTVVSLKSHLQIQ